MCKYVQVYGVIYKRCTTDSGVLVPYQGLTLDPKPTTKFP